ncbi:MAG: Hsp20/alpha crystallin family protein [Candidatus Woesearchaeota archaeon]|nr:MAG: Hsp20/alpha crystallin family protein [Candidatus Woesearchaeota archaeon]
MKTNIMKTITFPLMILAALLVAAVSVSAVSAVVSDIEINDISGFSGTVYVERDSTLDVKVDVTGVFDGTPVSSQDVRVIARIDGTEDDLEAKTPLYEVQEGVVRSFRLSIDIPSDIDAEEDYTLKIIIVRQDGLDQLFTFPLRVEEARHKLDIIETITRGTYEAGSILFVTVRAENEGDNEEENIRVEVRLEGTSAVAVGYIDDLDTDKQGSPRGAAASNNELFLRLPSDLAEGDYNLVSTLSYNGGREVVTESKKVHVFGTQPSAQAATLSLRADSTLKQVSAGNGVAYTVMFANTGSQAKTYTAQVLGTSAWASSARVDPVQLTVGSGQTGEFVAFVQASSSAEAGRKAFTVQVSEGNTVVGEINLAADLTGAQGASAQTALWYAFIALVVILVVLGLAIAFSRMKRDDEEGPSTQTYY